MVDWDLLPVEKKIPYEASRWQSLDVLLDIQEIEELFSFLPPFCLYMTAPKSEVPKRDDKEAWICIYREYQKGLLLGLREKESALSAFIADDPKRLYGLVTPSNKILIRPKAPLLQVGVHAFYFNEEERVFHSQIYGTDSISWGVHIVFPWLFEDPDTKEVKKLTDPLLFPSLALFKSLQSWLRDHSTPASFLVHGKRAIAPFRIGRKARIWAKELPQLIEKGLALIVPS